MSIEEFSFIRRPFHVNGKRCSVIINCALDVKSHSDKDQVINSSVTAQTTWALFAQILWSNRVRHGSWCRCWNKILDVIATNRISTLVNWLWGMDQSTKWNGWGVVQYFSSNYTCHILSPLPILDSLQWSSSDLCQQKNWHRSAETQWSKNIFACLSWADWSLAASYHEAQFVKCTLWANRG